MKNSLKARKEEMDNNKKLNKVLPVAAASLLIANVTLPVAVASATSKEEVVYVNANAYGKVENIDVVNIFSLEHAGVIEDFGEYSKVRNMTTKDKIDTKDGKVTVDVNNAGKIYYDGRLVSTVAPWTLSIKYYLDGEEKTAPEIAGASGKLKIDLKAARNNDYAGPDFFSNYALQGTVQLDTAKAENIVAEKATIANVGQKKQLTYIALPGKGLDITIVADVKDFEMDGFSINGIPLNINVNVDDTELMNKVAELKDAVGKLDDGTGTLNSGIKMLADGINEVDENMKKLDSHSEELASGPKKMLEALKTLKSQLPDTEELAAKMQALKTGAATISTNLGNLSTNMTSAASGYTFDNYKAQMKAAIGDAAYDSWETSAAAVFTEQYFNNTTNGLSATLGALSTGAAGIKTGFDAQLQPGIEEIVDTIPTLVTGLNTAINQFITEVGKLSDGTTSYTEGVSKLVAGYQLLVNGVSSVSAGGDTLKNGTREFRNETANLDTTVSNKIDELIASIKGKANIGSFVSDKNTDIKAVQFVMKTEKIEKPVAKVEKKEEVREKKSFWEKFLDLFRF